MECQNVPCRRRESGPRHPLDHQNEDTGLPAFFQTVWRTMRCRPDAINNPNTGNAFVPADGGQHVTYDDSKVARVTGLEPATPGVTGRYSNQLSYTRAWATAAAVKG